MRFPLMRATLPLFLLAGLAACDGEREPAENRLDVPLPKTSEASEPPGNRVTATDPGANESAAADAADMVPVALQGRWAGLRERCGDAAAAMELQVTPDRLIFHESVGTIRRVTRKGEDSVVIDAAFTGEGESWNRRLELRASGDGRELTVANDGQSVVRKRCGDAGAV